MEKCKTLGIRGPINTDGSVHRCTGSHKQDVVEPTTYSRHNIFGYFP